MERRYGDVDLLANAYVLRALRWPEIRPDNPSGLDSFAIFLVECKNAVHSINAARVLEYSENIKRLVSKFRFYLHERWRNIVMNKKENSDPVTFTHLVDFVQREDRKATDPVYGRLALGGKPKDDKTGRPKLPI